MTSPETSGPQNEPAGRPRDTVHHVIACNPCRDSVQGLQGKKDVLSYLASPRRDPALVENVLSKSALIGKHELGKLLYEMGRAALVLVPEVSERVDFMVQPDDLGSIAKRAKLLSCRVPMDQVEDVLDQPLDCQPAPDEAARLVISFAELNLSVMGRTTNTLLLQANGLSALQDYSSAVQIIEGAITASTNRLEAIASRINMAQALIRIQDYEGAALRSQEFLLDYSSAPELWYNFAVSAAWLKRSDAFKSACKGLRDALSKSRPNAIYWRRLLATDGAWFATRFGLSESEVANELGSSSLEGAE